MAQLVRATGDAQIPKALGALDRPAAPPASHSIGHRRGGQGLRRKCCRLKKLVPSLSDAAIKSDRAKDQAQLNDQVGGAVARSAGTPPPANTNSCKSIWTDERTIGTGLFPIMDTACRLSRSRGSRRWSPRRDLACCRRGGGIAAAYQIANAISIYNAAVIAGSPHQAGHRRHHGSSRHAPP